MKNKFLKQAEEHVCDITLSELESKRSKFEFIKEFNHIEASEYREIILYSPSGQSNLGAQLSKSFYENVEFVLDEIKRENDLKDIFLFSSFKSSNKKTDIGKTIKEKRSAFLLLHTNNTKYGILSSLYSCLRNALAHGNIVKKGKFYYLYSVKKVKEIEDKDCKITFLLKIYKLENIKTFMEIFKNNN